jgi:hypothetical protein
MALFVKLLLLAFMAAVFILASNKDAFAYMNQFPWFRMVRNTTTFLFLFLGRLGADAFAAISGQEHKPRIDQIHQATILVVELFTLILLVSTSVTVYGTVVQFINDKARKKLREEEKKVENLSKQMTDSRPVAIRTRLNALPGFNVLQSTLITIASLRAIFPPPPRPQLPNVNPSTPIGAQQANLLLNAGYMEDYHNRLMAHINCIHSEVKKAETISDEINAIVSGLKEVLTKLDLLERKYSIFTRMPDSATLIGVRQRAKVVLVDSQALIAKLQIYLKALNDLAKESGDLLAESQQHAQECRIRLEELQAAEARAARNKLAADAVQALTTALSPRNPRGFAVLICVFLLILQIAMKHSATSLPPRASGSQTSQLALFENYMAAPDHFNFAITLALEIAGAFRSLFSTKKL